MSSATPAVRERLDDDGLVHVVFDRPGERVNLLSADVLVELDRIVESLAGRAEVRGVLFRSAKPGTFIAGVDLEDIAALDGAFAAAEAARFGQGVFQKIAALPIPTAAAIDGACMGGGTELALACSTRLAADASRTRIGLPETRIGIVPGFGGCQRLPRLIGISAALDLILSGRSVDAREARRLGLVDVVCPPEFLEREARAALLGALARGPRAFRAGWRAVERVVESTPPLRKQALERARRKLLERVRPETHPAPFRALEAIEAAFTLPLHAGLDVEARLIGELVPSRTTKNLVWLFKNRTALRRGAHDAGALPREIRKIAILGAGRTGARLARLAADTDLAVRVHDPDPEALLAALRAARAHWDRAGVRGGAEWISPTTELTGIARADVVVETLAPDLAAQRAALAQVEGRIGERAVIAAHTSSVPVSEIAGGAVRPERVVGVHVVEPADSAQIVEVVPGPRTSPEALATGIDLVVRLGKVPIVVRDRPGFLVSRVQGLYFAEAVRLIEDGVPVATIDQAAREYGMAEGPFERLDRIGIDAVLHSAVVLREAFGRRVEGLVAALERMTAAGLRGAPGGRGFYRWDGDRRGRAGRPPAGIAGRSASELSVETVQERLTLILINEAAACLEDAVARSARDVDLALVFGIGFPPFRGGPLHEADTIGIAVVADRLSRLSEALGERFRPVGLLRAMVREERRFYPPVGGRPGRPATGRDV